MLTSSPVSFRCSWCMRLSQCVQRATYHAPPKSTWIFFLTFHGFVHLINSYYYENTFQRCLRLTLKNETKNWQILSYDEICRQITRHSQKIYNMVIYKRSICICICQPSWKIPDWQQGRGERRQGTRGGRVRTKGGTVQQLNGLCPWLPIGDVKGRGTHHASTVTPLHIHL